MGFIFLKILPNINIIFHLLLVYSIISLPYSMNLGSYRFELNGFIGSCTIPDKDFYQALLICEHTLYFYNASLLMDHCL